MSGKICATCLVVDVRMIRITQQIRKNYLEITGLQVTDCVTVPGYVCYLCHAQILKFNKFKRKCLTAQKVLNLIAPSKKKISKTALKALNRKAYGLDSDLSVNVLNSIETSVQSFVYSSDDDIMNDDPLSVKIEDDELDLFEPRRSRKVLKKEKELIYIEVPKPSYSIIENKATHEQVTVEVEMQDYVKDESDADDVDINYSDNELKSIESNLKTKKVNEQRNTLKAKKKDVERGKIRQLCYVQGMTPEDQKIRLLSRQLSAAYTSKKYKCELCYTGFNSEIAYKNHKNKHEYGVFGKYLCDICKKYTSSKLMMYYHIQRYHFYKFYCKKCGHISHTFPGAHLHQNKKHENISYRCPSCDKELRNENALYLHKQKFHAALPCGLCGHCFVNKAGLVLHKKSKHGVKGESTLEMNKEHPLYCKDCQTLFADSKAYCLHMVKSSIHTVEEALKHSGHGEQITKELSRYLGSKRKAIPCHVCELMLYSNQAAVKHYRKEHPGTKVPCDHICHVCGKNFSDPYTFNSHMNTHTKAVKYDCPECPKTFTFRANLTRHIKQAHREFDLMCQFCEYKTSSNFELRIHVEEVHLNIPYMPRILAAKRRVERKRRNKCLADSDQL